MSMVMATLTGRMGVEPILPVNNRHNVKTLMGRFSVSFGVGTCEQGLNPYQNGDLRKFS